MNDGKVWHEKIMEHKKHRTKMLELNLEIQEAMTEYLKTVGETEDFSIRFEDFGAVELSCNGDLFNLEQIGGFCEVFNLDITINNRSVIENHLADSTSVRTEYLFSTKSTEAE